MPSFDGNPHMNAIEVENVSKLYRIGEIGTGTLAHDLNRLWYRIRGKVDPYERIGAKNDRTLIGESPYVWALKNVNFQVEEGQVLGVIGRNGAGKSTLLKLLSRVTLPSQGTIRARGRIASLLEVGTGFHPELTGRENIFLNGAILGMRRASINRQLDAIVDFSGCERYLDTPVKRYSSGMAVRLGFAVAAHLDCEILIVDEVLAVGDLEFQTKCLGRMRDVSQNGRTILFVSHNLNSIAQLCTKAILLENGEISAVGAVSDVVDRYCAPLQQSNVLEWCEHTVGSASEGSPITLSRLMIIPTNEVKFTNGMDISLRAVVNVLRPGNYSVCVSAKRSGEVCFILNSYHQNRLFELRSAGDILIDLTIPRYLLNPGSHTISFYMTDARGAHEHYISVEDKLSIQIEDDNRRRGGTYSGGWPGAVSPLLDFSITPMANA